LALVALGLALGAVQAVNLESARLDTLTVELSRQYSAIPSRSGLFLDAVLKNGGHMLLIWLMAFLPLGEWVACAALFVKAWGYGFSAGVLVRAHEAHGFSYPGPSFGFACVIILGAGLFLCLMNARYRFSSRKAGGPQPGRELTEYALMLLIAESCVILSAMV
jgi:hypothetical protein